MTFNQVSARKSVPPIPTRLRTRDDSGQKLVEVFGKGGKERRIPLHTEAFERSNQWLRLQPLKPVLLIVANREKQLSLNRLDAAGLRADPAGPLFRPTSTARRRGCDGFIARPLTRRAIQAIVKRCARRVGLDPAVTVHSFRVTALTTARERGAEIIDLQDFAGHSDPRTTLSNIARAIG